MIFYTGSTKYALDIQSELNYIIKKWYTKYQLSVPLLENIVEFWLYVQYIFRRLCICNKQNGDDSPQNDILYSLLAYVCVTHQQELIMSVH